MTVEKDSAKVESLGWNIKARIDDLAYKELAYVGYEPNAGRISTIVRDESLWVGTRHAVSLPI